MTTVLIQKTPLLGCVQRLEVHAFGQKLCENHSAKKTRNLGFAPGGEKKRRRFFGYTFQIAGPQSGTEMLYKLQIGGAKRLRFYLGVQI